METNLVIVEFEEFVNCRVKTSLCIYRYVLYVLCTQPPPPFLRTSVLEKGRGRGDGQYSAADTAYTYVLYSKILVCYT